MRFKELLESVLQEREERRFNKRKAGTVWKHKDPATGVRRPEPQIKV